MQPPADPADEWRGIERRFYERIGARSQIRVVVRALVILDDHVLLMRPPVAAGNYYFPGGELEFGEQLEYGLRRELAEETSVDIRRMTYRFTANNRYQREDAAIHMLEHFFEVTPASFDVESLEPPVEVEWQPIAEIRSLDIRPWGVRDLIGVSGWRTVRLLEVE
jgi:ADP-ribose pyrophosphatase YjhB (NUDIX family)